MGGRSTRLGEKPGEEKMLGCGYFCCGCGRQERSRLREGAAGGGPLGLAWAPSMRTARIACEQKVAVHRTFEDRWRYLTYVRGTHSICAVDSPRRVGRPHGMP